jgi:hypothetical protein
VHYACATNHVRGAPFRRPVPSVQRSGPPCASTLSITCCTPFLSVAACGGLHVSVVHPTRRAHACQRAPRSRFAPRTCTAAPSHGPSSMRASSRGANFRPFRTPQNPGWGVGLRQALQCCSSVWFGRPSRRWPRRRRPRRRSRSVPPPQWMDSVFIALQASHAHALSGNIRLIRTEVRCVRPAPCDCARACVRRDVGGDCVCVRVVEEAINS